MTRIQIRKDSDQFGSLYTDPDLDPHSDKRLDPKHAEVINNLYKGTIRIRANKFWIRNIEGNPMVVCSSFL
jgi:hypothetical protein